MNHTPESLLALTKSPEGLEQMRIIAAQFDGWTQIAFRRHPDSNKICNDEPDALWFGVNPEKTGVCKLAEYPTSLDAIFAAEERAGIHDKPLKGIWCGFVEELLALTELPDCRSSLAFLPPPLRLIPFILTAQWKEQNQ